MGRITVHHYDAFSARPGKGNPAGVVLGGERLSDDDMQRIAATVGFNETVFVLPSLRADLRLRYWTPGHEMDLCGHATVASFFALEERGALPPRPATLETNAGILSIGVGRDESGAVQIEMAQAPAQFRPFSGDAARLAAAIGLDREDLVADLPIVYGSTGIWTLVVPVTGLAAMRRMRPRSAEFPALLAELPRASIHPVCFETIDPAADMHGRHFSSPFSGTVEDPVTGTASGVLGAYVARYRRGGRPGAHAFLVEQGQEIGCDGRVKVRVEVAAERYEVAIAGTAVFVGEQALEFAAGDRPPS